MPVQEIIELIDGIVDIATYFSDRVQRKRAEAAVDLLLLAAHHDHRITAAEREQLTEQCRRRLGDAVDVAALLTRSEDRRADLETPAAFAAEVDTLAAALAPAERPTVLEAVERILEADESAEGGSQDNALAVFRRALASR